jgi:hypothetical protein
MRSVGDLERGRSAKPAAIAAALILAVSVGGVADARFTADVETGFAFSGYNDVRIPGNSGTLFSLSEELETETSPFFRLRLGYMIGQKHSMTLLVAPLRLAGEGQVDRPVFFEDREFPANTPLKSTYRFDSYRLGYRYTLYDTPKIQFALGVTAKIRDASIKLEDDSQTAEKTNTGFVPLVSFMARWRPARTVSMLLDGDALAGPQGRAEDILLALEYNPSRMAGLRVGYRILEGGADVNEVYNFTLINYLVLGGVLYL